MTRTDQLCKVASEQRQPGRGRPYQARLCQKRDSRRFASSTGHAVSRKFSSVDPPSAKR
jgi:hypothetical protein